MDLYSRRIVGWSMSDTMQAKMVSDALLMALWRRGKPSSLMHHSDQGSQGGFNRSSQHLQQGGVYGKTSGMDEAVHGPVGDEVSWHKTVAEEYFNVTEKVEALYGQPQQLPRDDEGSEMSKLRGEMHRRMLGNGHCARPIETDC